MFTYTICVGLVYWEKRKEERLVSCKSVFLFLLLANEMCASRIYICIIELKLCKYEETY